MPRERAITEQQQTERRREKNDTKKTKTTAFSTNCLYSRTYQMDNIIVSDSAAVVVITIHLYM